jgi:hypothetical protein
LRSELDGLVAPLGQLLEPTGDGRCERLSEVARLGTGLRPAQRLEERVSARQEVHDPADQYGDANKESKGLGTVQQPVASCIPGDYSEDYGDQEGKEHQSVKMRESHIKIE